MKHIIFILHGKIRHRKELRKRLSGCLPSGVEATFQETHYAAHATEIAAKSVQDGATYVIAVGGDGLLNEVINGYMCASDYQRYVCAVGIYPMGTGNDFCKTVGIRPDTVQLQQLLERHSVKPVDCCYARFIGLHGTSTKRYFINIGDIGIGGAVSQRVNQSRKLLGAKLSYMKAIVRTFLDYRHRHVSITADNFLWEGPVLLVVTANGRYFGSGLCIAPQAQPDDGRMQVVILGNVSLLDYLRHQGAVRRCQIICHPEVHYLSSAFCRIETREECTIDIDGEFAGYGPMEVQIMPQAVNFLRP
ncbi:MAG: lipid kinase [Chitinophagales bacterium]|nr:MAG: lipid kinase [Chitinophagales bacterium]